MLNSNYALSGMLASASSQERLHTRDTFFKALAESDTAQVLGYMKTWGPKFTLQQEDDKGRFPLLFSTEQENEKMVLVLLHHGADINAKNRMGKTALMAAVKTKNLNIVQHLLKSDTIDVNAKDLHGYTPLAWLALTSSPPPDIMSELVDKGADVNAKTATGRSVIMFALQAGNISAAAFLFQHGAYLQNYDVPQPLLRSLKLKTSSSAEQRFIADVEGNTLPIIQQQTPAEEASENLWRPRSVSDSSITLPGGFCQDMAAYVPSRSTDNQLVSSAALAAPAPINGEVRDLQADNLMMKYQIGQLQAVVSQLSRQFCPYNVYEVGRQDDLDALLIKISQEIGKTWESLFCELMDKSYHRMGLTEINTKIEEIKESHPHCFESQARKAMTIWKQKQGEHANLEILANALVKYDRSDLADFVRNILEQWQMGPGRKTLC